MTEKKSLFKLVILDLDDCLTHEGLELLPPLCEDTLLVLLELKRLKYIVVLASDNENANQILQNVELIEFFDLVIAYPDDGTMKLTKFDMIASTFPHINKSNMILFDDMKTNVDCAIRYGMCGALVNWKKGIGYEEMAKIMGIS
ncbi:MAG: hypothetical protein Sylvanvirus21_3 [Sylvanvirus sp.]|uniref:Uncharacterized protein n=1 Tax=Sylvanvirus sp. TaxID=2487774 RepID=A0A3G5AK47_9VIRU|nr:MAG: hypothetical protein Sylvanvirus21_3 [Sylvanvirus sp.]